MIVLKIIGKKDCNPCESAKRKWIELLDKWNISDRVKFIFSDAEEDQGRAEAEFYEVIDFPCTVIEYKDEPIKIYREKIVSSEEVKRILVDLTK